MPAERRQLPPPYKPNVKSQADVHYVQTAFLKETAVDSTPGGDFVEGDAEYETETHFDNFNFCSEAGNATKTWAARAPDANTKAKGKAVRRAPPPSSVALM